MLLFIARRLLSGVAVFLAVTFVTYCLFLAPGGIATSHAILAGTFGNPTAQQTLDFAQQHGLLRPPPVQYLDWLTGLARGDFGTSFSTNSSVRDLLAARAPVTLSLVVVSLILTILLSVPLGVVAATRGGLVDRVLQVFAVVIQAIPGYWLALILVIVFGLTLRLVPATGYVDITESFEGWIRSIIVPSFAIAIGSVAFVGLQIRGAMIDILRNDYVRTLRSRGIRSTSIVFKHVLRNAAPPTLTILSLQVIGILSGVVIVERIYALPGLGSGALEAGQRSDLPTVIGTVAVVVVIVVVVNLLTDILNGFVNPKMRIR